MKAIEHNARQVARYLEWVWPLIEKGLVMPDEPPDRKHKGSSRPPLSEAAMKLIEENALVTAVLEPIIQEAKRQDVRFLGIAFSDLISEVTYRPEAVSRFRNLEQTPGEDGDRARAFFRMCRLFAYALKAYDGPGGPHILRVSTTFVGEDDDPRRAPGGPPRTYTAHDSYRRMVEEMEAMVLAGTHSKEGAKAAKADQLMCSMSRVRAAITFVNKERETVFDRVNPEAA